MSATLILRGEAGIGKSALCIYAIESSKDMVVLTARGVETEAGLPFAGLSELFRPILKHLDMIPRTQASALAGALALDEPTDSTESNRWARDGPHERFSVYAATLSLLAAAADQMPLLAVVDDAHWMDEPSTQALLFAARRLHAEGVVLLFTVRDGEPACWFEGTGLPEIMLSGLDWESSQKLLHECTSHRIAERVAEQIITAAGGNPLALVEIPSVMSQAQLAGTELIDRPLPAGPSLERVFRRRVAALPETARRALLMAAAHDSTALSEVAEALAVVGGDIAQLGQAEAAGLILVTGPVLEFRHPLLRSAVYRSATGTDRRAAHRALEQALPGEANADRRAWHLAAAATAADEAVAQALEQAGSNARRRGGPAAAAQALERAARLTPDAESRARRLVAAASDWHMAGRLHAAATLLEEALGSTSDSLLRADIQLLRGRVRTSSAPVMRSHDLLVEEGGRIESRDPTRAAMMFAEASVQALRGAQVSKQLCTARRAFALAEAAEGNALPTAGLTLAAALILAGDVATGYSLVLRWLPDVDLEDPLAVQNVLGGTGYALMSLTWVEDYDRAGNLLDQIIANLRAHSALATLPYLLAMRSELGFRTGKWTSAYADATESFRLAQEIQSTEYTFALCCLAYIEAAQGREADCRQHVARAARYIESLEIGSIRVYCSCVLGLLELGLGRNKEAIAALHPVATVGRELGLPATLPWAPDLIEAYVRDRRHDEAEKVLGWFQRQAEVTGQVWALAASARCRGLLCGSGMDANSHFEEAVRWHEGRSTPFERARTKLCWGERLRRDRQRSQACVQLRSALEIFEQLGATPWAERARAELRAAGARPHRRADWSAAQKLTAQELQVALTIAQGLTNPEAAAALFLSRKTIEFHLGNVYRKLGLRSRTELASRLATTAILDPRGAR